MVPRTSARLVSLIASAILVSVLIAFSRSSCGKWFSAAACSARSLARVLVRVLRPRAVISTSTVRSSLAGRARVTRPCRSSDFSDLVTVGWARPTHSANASTGSGPRSTSGSSGAAWDSITVSPPLNGSARPRLRRIAL
ncbi:MAG TPA: hypothetical protein VHZ97_14560 [Pseudonocardiaceae bacterium]|nr:hypothetical protein [Pseudonocardiaceae bacterium]